MTSPADAWMTGHLSALVQSTDDAVVSCGLDGTIRSWNPAAERLFGLAAAEAIGRPIAVLAPDGRLDEPSRLLARVVGGEIVRHFETVRRRGDGTEVEVSLTLSPVRNAAGDIVGASSIGRDISVRRDSELAAQRLAAIVESSDDAIVSKDLNGTVLTWNHAAERMFGYAAAEMIGRSILRIIPLDRVSEEDYVLSQLRAGRAIEQFETVRVRKDGTLIEVSLSVSPVRNHSGRVVGASKIARDITERKRLQEIRRRIAEQEHEGVRRELEDHNRRLEEAARLKTLFIANMSHELRTPLNAIIGFAELIDRGRAGGREAEFVGDILASARHLAQLIGDVLDLAKLEAGRIEFRPEPVRLPALTAEVCEIVRGMATPATTVGCEIDPSLEEVTVDPARLKQILYNYLSNAIKFTPDGGRIVVRAAPDGADRFRIDVEDTGIGIEADDLPKLFMDFQQLDASAAKRFAGTGLGLAVTKRLVEAQGGTVSVVSRPGVGSTFTARLPRRVPAFSAPAATTPPASP